MSGNIIDVCPVGALTSKPFRFTARAWELDQAPSVGPHDCIGSNLAVHTRYGKVMRVVSRENATINQTWISDRDRFSYTGLYHRDRLEEPIIKENGVWRAVDWKIAFEIAANSLNAALLEHGADKFGALASPSSTFEEFYLLQKIVRGLGCPHIDHRLREIDTKDQANLGSSPGLPLPITELSTCDAILLIGSNLPKEQPLIALQVRKAAEKRVPVLIINPVDYRFNFKTSGEHFVSPKEMVDSLGALGFALGDETLETFSRKETWQKDNLQSFIKHLKDKKNACILLGALALHHNEASLIRSLAASIADQTGAKIGMMTDGSNSRGGWLAGAVPHRLPGGVPINHVGLSAYEMLEKPRKAYLLLNVEPELDCANAHQAREALKQAKCVIALSMFRNPVLEDHANIILPIAPFTETAGTFINAWGTWQSFKSVATSFGESRPAWKVLRVLGNFLQLDGFDFESAEEVKHEIKPIIEKMPHPKSTGEARIQSSRDREGKKEAGALKENILSRIGEVPIYSIDSLVRHAGPLQATQTIMEGDVNAVRIHPETASKLHLSDGDLVRIRQEGGVAELVVSHDLRISKGAAWIAAAISKTSDLGNMFGEVMIEKV
jgi:NADH-quinone oxidoreductase subunit G